MVWKGTRGHYFLMSFVINFRRLCQTKFRKFIIPVLTEIWVGASHLEMITSVEDNCNVVFCCSYYYYLVNHQMVNI